MSDDMDVDDAGLKRQAEDWLDAYLEKHPRVASQYGTPEMRKRKSAFLGYTHRNLDLPASKKYKFIRFAKRAWEDWEDSGTPQRPRRRPAPLDFSILDDDEIEQIDDALNRMDPQGDASLIHPEGLGENTSSLGSGMSFASLGGPQPQYVKAPSSLKWTRAQRLDRYGPSMSAAAARADAKDEGSWYQNRITDQYYGRGAYKKRKYGGRGKYTFGSFIRDVESVGRRAEPTINRFMTKGIPRIAKAAGVVKGMMGRGLYSGRGMYNKNVLIEGGTPGLAMGSQSLDNQEVIIKHTEYLQDVYGPANANFTNNELDINPGLMENFPFLGQIAANYEEYEFIQLIFHFKSTVDAAQSTTGAVGTLIMATNYNADAANFLSKESMMQYHGANNTRLDKDMDHGVECDPSKNAGTAIRFTRTVPLVDSQQKKEFDLGKFQWAIVNIPSNFNNQQLGELWVTYCVKLAKPKLAVSLGRTIAEDRFISNGGESTTSILGTGLLKLMQSNIGCSLSEASAGAGLVTLTITFPDFLTGRYEIELRKYADGLGVGTHTVGGNVTFVQDLWTGSSYNNGTVNFGSAGTSALVMCHVDVRPATAGVDNTLVIACSSVSTSASEIVIRPYNPDLSNRWTSVSTGVEVVPS